MNLHDNFGVLYTQGSDLCAYALGFSGPRTLSIGRKSPQRIIADATELFDYSHIEVPSALRDNGAHKGMVFLNEGKPSFLYRTNKGSFVQDLGTDGFCLELRTPEYRDYHSIASNTHTSVIACNERFSSKKNFLQIHFSDCAVAFRRLFSLPEISEKFTYAVVARQKLDELVERYS